jgi:hypothetical protein
VRVRRFLFERGDNLAGGIYGTILVTSIIAAADFDENIWRSLALVLVTGFVFWLAHLYAHALAASLEQRQTMSFDVVRRVAVHEWPLLQAAFLPSFMLLLGAVGLVETKTAYRLAVGVGVATLIWWGLVFSRKEGLSRRATAAVVLVNAAFGTFLVALKELVGH